MLLAECLWLFLEVHVGLNQHTGNFIYWIVILKKFTCVNYCKIANQLSETIIYLIVILKNICICQLSLQPSLHHLVGLLEFVSRKFTQPQSQHILVQCFTSFLPAHPSIAHFLHVLLLRTAFATGLFNDFKALALVIATDCG